MLNLFQHPIIKVAYIQTVLQVENLAREVPKQVRHDGLV
jgi:hypothetical protein